MEEEENVNPLTGNFVYVEVVLELLLARKRIAKELASYLYDFLTPIRFEEIFKNCRRIIKECDEAGDYHSAEKIASKITLNERFQRLMGNKKAFLEEFADNERTAS